jgi:transcriptional regulator with XRE-family HTH domain
MVQEVVAREVDSRWVVNHEVLYRARIMANITAAEAARRCGWSRQYHNKLENGHVNTLSRDAVLKILDAFPELTI